MRIPIRSGLLATAVILLVFTVSCGKNDQEAQKFNRADAETFKRDMSEMSLVKLSNGITLYLQEERTDNEVAIEAIYRAGYIADPKGKAQLAHLTEHMTMTCATGKYKAGETMSAIQNGEGKISAEAVAGFIHIDYVVQAEKLEEALAIEASRLTDLRCDEATLKEQVKKVVGEYPAALENPRGNIVRVSMSALAQILYYGATYVPMQTGVASLTLDDVKKFHEAHYRPDDMMLVLIGNFKKADAEALVRKYFESIPSRPAPPQPKVTLKRSVNATWDVAANATVFVSPGDYTPKERLILTMFGAFLQQLFAHSPEVYGNCQAIYTSNQTYPVGALPFFIFIQAKEGYGTDIATPGVFDTLEQAVTSLDDDNRVELVKTGMISFMTSTGLKEDEPDYPVMHYQVIGQEALMVGLKHMLLEGRTMDEFADEVNAISADDFRATVHRYLDKAAFLTINIKPRG